MEAELIRKALDENELLKSCGINVQETVAISLSRGRTITDWYAGKPQVGLVAKGTLSVFSRSEDGHEVLLNIQRQGDIFGISNLFLENSLETTLRGKTNSTLIFISKETLRCHLLSDMNAMQAYARFCNEKIQFLLGRLEALTPRSARSRLIAHILATSDGGTVSIPNKDALAKSLGIGRSSLYRELENLENLRLITTMTTKSYAIDSVKLQNALGDLT
ncbi:MAG: Crp/Fnr family transcriptional regulator [Sphaerochaetaceae bacterium]